MKPKQFIEQSIEGGWKSKYHSDLDWNGDGFYVHILDPLAWQAVGKVEGWTDVKRWGYHPSQLWCDYQLRMHRIIDALCEGKSIEQFLETL